MPFKPELSPLTDDVYRFFVGTCNGIFDVNAEGVNIIGITNENPGNGHVDDVFEWFEYAAAGADTRLWVREIYNQRFKQRCLTKRGFIQSSNPMDIYKDFKQESPGDETGANLYETIPG
jgi:hypothetical protein